MALLTTLGSSEMVRSGKQRGFTLIEMMIVISMILILLAIAIPHYRRSILMARETMLKDDLFTLRQVIDEYSYDKKKAPQSLDDLVSEGYIKQIPRDPFTNQRDWLTDPEDPTKATDPNTPGIGDVHSNSQFVGTDGTAYNTW